MMNKARTLLVSGKMMALVATAAVVGGTIALVNPAFAQTAQPQGQAQSGQQRPALTGEQMATMRHDMDTALHYKLAPDVLPRLTSTLKAIHAANIQPPGRLGMSLDEQVSMVEKVPGLPPILKANGFTPHDFVMSLTCVGLTGSLMNVQPGQANSQVPTPEAANVALLKAHPEDLQALITVLRAEQAPK
ncbi:hypothetical protein [Acetobacter indonesiensis]